MKKTGIVFTIMAMALLTACQNRTTNYTEISTSDTLVATSSDCNDKVCAHRLFIEAAQALDEADSLLLHTTLQMTSTEQVAEVMDMTVFGTVARLNTDDGDTQMKITLTTRLPDMEIPVVSFFRNGMFYVEVFNQGVKIPMVLEDVVQGANAAITTFPREAVLTESATEVSGGVQRLSFEVDPMAIQHVVESQFEGSSIVSAINNAQIEAYLTGNVLSRIETTADFTLEVDGQMTDASLWSQVDVVQVGGMLIHFPSHLDDFTEVESHLMSVALE